MVEIDPEVDEVRTLDPPPIGGSRIAGIGMVPHNGDGSLTLVVLGKPAVPHLLALLEDTDPDVRSRVADEDPNSGVRSLAVSALGRLSAGRTPARLLRALDSADPGTRTDAMRAVARMRERDALPHLERSGRCRMQAADVLLALDDPEALPVLGEAATTDTDALTHRVAVKAVRHIERSRH